MNAKLARSIAVGHQLDDTVPLDELARMADWAMKVQRHAWLPMTEVHYDIEVDLT